MIYITGDIHGDLLKVQSFCKQKKTSVSDILIILGDVGLNFYNDFRDLNKWMWARELPITLFCIQGNHDLRPTKVKPHDSFSSMLMCIDSNYKKPYKRIKYKGAYAYHTNCMSNVYFAIDGSVYTFDDKKILVCGGAYSPDKEYRTRNNLPWFSDEQPNKGIKHKTLNSVRDNNDKVDFVLTHTIPFSYIKELNLPPIDFKLDTSTEEFLDVVRGKLSYKRWYAGHFHVDKTINNDLRILYNDVIELGD